MGFLELTLQFVVVFVYLAIMIFGFNLARNLYGGRFTLFIPYILVAVSLLFALEMWKIFAFIFPMISQTVIFDYSMDVIQLTAGFFLLAALYQLYQMGYATAGFLEEK